MKFEDVMMLIRAGYTKNDIQDLLAEKAPEPAPAPTPTPAAPEPEPAPAPEPEPAPTPAAPMDQMMQAMQNMIRQNQQMLQAIQAANIQAARMPEDTKETPEDLIAKIIAPGPKAEKGGNK